jgi:hypothetical protein
MRRREAAMTALVGLALAAFAPASASGAATAAWQLTVTPMPANFTPGETDEYLLLATNVGAASTGGQVTVEATLPSPLELVSAQAVNITPGSPEPECSADKPSRTVVCTTEGAVPQGRWLRVAVRATVPLAAKEEVVFAEAKAAGGGAAQETTVLSPTQIGPNPLEFGFLPGFAAPVTEEDGTPATLAGSHPYQLTLDLGFPTEDPGAGLTNAGHPRDVYAELPRGLLGDPAATPVLCTEAELTTEAIAKGEPDCPEASQVGVIDLLTFIGPGAPGIITSQLYAMVPPPGVAAAFATNAGRFGIFIHFLAAVRSDGDYGVQTASHDLLALGANPIFGVQAQVWGDPSSDAHNAIRGVCLNEGGACPAEEKAKAPFLTMPTGCPEEPLAFGGHGDSWEKPFPEFEEARASYEGAEVDACEELKFEPSIKSRPTTNVADSPSGLEFDLHQRQAADPFEVARAALKDATITLPAGMGVNASQAGGLGVCDSTQIGLLTPVGVGPAHFSKAPQSCPEASKLGTLEARTPLLVRRDLFHEVELDPETGEPVLETLEGTVYLAKPFDNPFKSLISVYFVIEDPKTGIVAKLAGKAEPDPVTGQITTRVEENPELPLEDIRVILLGGPRGALVTPPTCGSHTTDAHLVPWSSPPAPSTQVSDSFETTVAPNGGPCPSTEAQLPNSPKLRAGTLSPQAGAYSPLIFKLSRADGTQRLARLDATLPTGLSARLAGLGTCSQADIAKAISRERPEEGVLERRDPSCPASSEVGVINAAAGAGPDPYYAQGHLYLAGPYRGAPLSAVAIVPAVAGPFDLGTSVVRSAIFLDPTTAQARIASDPFPTVIQGIPIDLRSVAVRAERPDFTLNPTSCAEKAFGGSVFSSLGLAAPLFTRFQVGGCSALPFKPRLSARLFGPAHRGANPRFRAVLTAKPGEANISRFVLTLPHSEFIDQAHFRTICTRVQFAAGQCPPGSIYGNARAFTPLLDYPLEGPIYLRSSSHKLPDVVAALRGPPSQPVEIDGVGRVDSVHGGLRTTVETVPDAPLTKLVVNMQGGAKGLFQNSTNICRGKHRMSVELDGQNSKTADARPLLRASCAKRHRKGGRGKATKGGRQGR